MTKVLVAEDDQILLENLVTELTVTGKESCCSSLSVDESTVGSECFHKRNRL